MRKFPSIVALGLLAPVSSAFAQTRLENHLRAVPWKNFEDQAVRLLTEYLRIDTSNPPGNELVTARFFQRLFNQAGIPNTLDPYGTGRANFYARLKGDGSLRPVVLLNHMDVVRADGSNWKAPPFAGRILDGELYGRGALDMKDEGVIQAMVMLIAKSRRLPLRRDLIFLATADEEVNDTGSAWILEKHPEVVKGAEYLITEGGSNLIYPSRGTIYGIGVAEKAPLWIRMTATGRGGHGSIPIPDSAPNSLVNAIQRVLEWQPPIRLIPSVEQYFHQIAAREKEPRATQFRNIRRELQSPLFAKELTEDENFNFMLRDTISLTMLTGSPQANVIPDTASAEFDVRLLPGEDPNAFLVQLKKVVGDERIQLKPVSRFRPPNASSTNTALYRIIEQVVHEYSPQALATPALNSGYTESQMYRPLGLVCYGFIPIEVTPELEATEHAANERIPVEQVRRAVKILYEVVARVASP